MSISWHIISNSSLTFLRSAHKQKNLEHFIGSSKEGENIVQQLHLLSSVCKAHILAGGWQKGAAGTVSSWCKLKKEGQVITASSHLNIDTSAEANTKCFHYKDGNYFWT